jgi:hypothetical protein
MDGRVPPRGDEKYLTKSVVGNPDGKDIQQDLNVAGKKILKWIFGTGIVGIRTESVWLRIEIVGVL